MAFYKRFESDSERRASLVARPPILDAAPDTREFADEKHQHVARRERHRRVVAPGWKLPDAMVLRINTPRGLDSAIRNIIRAMLAPPVPALGFLDPTIALPDPIATKSPCQ